MYALRPEPLSAVRGWLDDVEGFWSTQLDAFKAHLEKRARRLGEGKPRDVTARARDRAGPGRPSPEVIEAEHLDDSALVARH